MLAAAAFAQDPPAGSASTQKLPEIENKPDLDAKKRSTPDKIRRWIEFETLSVATRYRFIEFNSQIGNSNQLQYQLNASMRFRFDSEGKYRINATAATGSNITSGWNNTGIGTGNGVTTINLKQLYFEARPVDWLAVHVGGFGPIYGENTEITGLDKDSYLMGERVQVRLPRSLYFDEMTATNAYIGDVNVPNVFRRFKRLSRSNYHHLMLRKRVNKRVAFSADYTLESGRDTLHQAVNIQTPELKAVDRLLFENYQIFDPGKGYGFNVQAVKKLDSRLTVSGGFARIDRPMFNSDRFPPGKRWYVFGDLKITRELSLNTALIRAVGDLPSGVSPRTRFDLVLSYNVLETLRRLKVQ